MCRNLSRKLKMIFETIFNITYLYKLNKQPYIIAF
ncbi:hypothetical protein BDE36_0050 [Arcticibacter tournemirensis]|nr:hypothetical protein BDE36_0050 [Arcticibacter tournemirensis]